MFSGEHTNWKKIHSFYTLTDSKMKFWQITSRNTVPCTFFNVLGELEEHWQCCIVHRTEVVGLRSSKKMYSAGVFFRSSSTKMYSGVRELLRLASKLPISINRPPVPHSRVGWSFRSFQKEFWFHQGNARLWLAVTILQGHVAQEFNQSI